MGVIVIIPALVAAFIAWKRSAAIAFLDVYVPVLLLLPEYYRWILPLVPDPTFSQATILPIIVVLAFREYENWRWSPTDFLILGYVLFVAVSEYSNVGYKEAQNLMFDMVASVLFPYIATKALIVPNGLGLRFARRFSILLFAIAIGSLFEFRFGMTPWQLAFNRFFPGQADAWVTTFRYGFARVAGPYGHAILAGLIFVIGYRIQRWIEWSGGWESRFRFVPGFRASKAGIITLGILGGTLMTFSRGPWLGGIAGALLTAVGRAKDRKRAAVVLFAGVSVIGIPAAVAFYNYASVGRLGAETASQETVAYRFELITRYVDIAMERPLLGWGRNTWPRVRGMSSIDNYYLLLALMHGLVASALLAAILVSLIVRLIRFEMRRPPPALRGSSLGFTLAGILLAVAVTITTVFGGLNAIPILAVVVGWSEGYLLGRPATNGGVGATREALIQDLSVRPFRFRRVMT